MSGFGTVVECGNSVQNSNKRINSETDNQKAGAQQQQEGTLFGTPEEEGQPTEEQGTKSEWKQNQLGGHLREVISKHNLICGKICLIRQALVKQTFPSSYIIFLMESFILKSYNTQESPIDKIKTKENFTCPANRKGSITDHKKM